MGEKWHLIILICISLMISELVYHFMCLLAICILLWITYYLCFFIFTNCRDFLYIIMDISHLLYVWQMCVYNDIFSMFLNLLTLFPNNFKLF